VFVLSFVLLSLHIFSVLNFLRKPVLIKRRTAQGPRFTGSEIQNLKSRLLHALCPLPFALIALLLPCTVYLVPCTSVAEAATVTLAWDPNPESDIAGYKIHYGNASESYDYSVDVGNYTSCTISGLAEGTTYYFAAKAYNTGNVESGFSSELVYTIPLPPSPPPAVDTDGDGILDDDEFDVYGTDPDRADTDGDGINDGEELEYWRDSWKLDYDGDGAVNLLDLDSDNDTVSDGEEVNRGYDPSNPGSKPSNPDSTPRSSIVLEFGEAQIDHIWTRIDLQKSFVDPIVVANPASLNDSDPAVVRIRNVSSSGFEIRIQEWGYLDDRHAFERVGYLVMERGSFTLEDGTRLEAGRFSTSKTGSFGQISFNQTFRTAPVVITSIASFNETDAVTGRLRNIDTQGFDFCLQEQESNSKNHNSETINYIAWEPSAGSMDGLTYEINRTANEVNQNFHTVQFNRNFITDPVFMADMQTANSMDTANVRWQNKDSQTVEVQIDEEQSRNRQTKHNSETVGYMVFSY
jgi:hypothetical protein